MMTAMRSRSFRAKFVAYLVETAPDDRRACEVGLRALRKHAEPAWTQFIEHVLREPTGQGNLCTWFNLRALLWHTFKAIAAGARPDSAAFSQIAMQAAPSLPLVQDGVLLLDRTLRWCVRHDSDWSFLHGILEAVGTAQINTWAGLVELYQEALSLPAQARFLWADYARVQWLRQVAARLSDPRDRVLVLQVAQDYATQSWTSHRAA